MLEDRGFHNKTICYLKPANLSILAFDQKSFGNIPEHLILFLGLGLISTILYCLLSYCQVFETQELQEGLSTRPCIVSLILGRQDAWLNKYRGEEVVNYIRFQRLIILESLIILVFSLISFTINWNNKEAEEEDILASTTILTLDSVSSWQCCIKNFYTENHYNKDGLNTHKLRQVNQSTIQKFNIVN
ncbi:uncharacterized protein LOC111695607 [Eurytemora carolleeae]|uniref:uncharacterized protein LOC111695607 n=1 Tax=Eurytemora carolleeae TaxID=1294199 RepID=UPI000C761B7A|nr:uncharacterized protein LOC111695607 [Eurytemora carolleeae]|eukprot:XP_023320753.1 uncharacterized protein LOC111695607 [Eurytemora affinis]